jgi:hypothetical protein
MLNAKILNGRKRRSTHPGEMLREVVLPEIGMSQGEFASTRSLIGRELPNAKSKPNQRQLG